MKKKLEELLSLPHETEWIEFKEAKTTFHFDDLGKYFSALANEANLKEQHNGWLIFGVKNKDHRVCGSNYRAETGQLDSLKHEIAKHTSGHSFSHIHVIDHPDGRVVMFEIPPAPKGIPIPFKGHYYGRDGESLVALALTKLEQIRSQGMIKDWSAEIIKDATIYDLDEEAIHAARKNFIAKNQNKPYGNEIDHWPDDQFLDRARLTKNGSITNACFLLLGKEEKSFLLEPSIAQIIWKLDDEKAYEHFNPPFLLTTNKIYEKIRNPNQKIDIPTQLIPYEIPKYEKYVILEALHNAIAHQDYKLQGRIIITESTEKLIFENMGSFFEGTISDYTILEKTPQRYRNRFLAEAMVNLNMIDTMGYGIRRMYQEQKKRFYPLPDYDLTEPDKVVVTIFGKVIDPNYTALLMEKKDLPLPTVILLDNVQKNKHIEKNEATRLRKEKLIEGRYPNLFIASHLALSPDNRVQYIKNRAFDDEHYKKMILTFIKRYNKASRQDIDNLLIDKLSNVLSLKQKENKVRNLLHYLSREKKIKNIGGGRKSIWVLTLDKNSDI